MDDGRTVHRKLKLGERVDQSVKKIVFSKEKEEQDILDRVTQEEVTRSCYRKSRRQEGITGKERQ